jgi:predicted histidine transporter YuiF (NhaC family)
MKKIIKKILKEEFENKNISSDNNICDIMTVNSLEEILGLLKNMDLRGKEKEIKNLLISMEKEKERLSNNKDIFNSYLRKIQNILCV